MDSQDSETPNSQAATRTRQGLVSRRSSLSSLLPDKLTEARAEIP